MRKAGYHSYLTPNGPASGALYVQLSDKTVTGTSEGSLMAIPPLIQANQINTSGKIIRLRLSGRFTIPAGGANAELRLYYGSTILNQLTEVFASNVSDVYFEKEITVTVRTTGTIAQLSTTGRSVTGTASVIPFTRSLTTANITLSGLFNLTIQFDRAGCSITSQMLYVELLN